MPPQCPFGRRHGALRGSDPALVGAMILVFIEFSATSGYFKEVGG